MKPISETSVPLNATSQAAPLLSSPWLGVAITILSLALLSTIGAMLSDQELKVFLSESGPIELASELSWILLAIVVAAFHPMRRRWTLGLAATALILAAREAEWHKAFTADSIFKTNYYERSDVALSEHLIAGGVAALALIVVLAILIKSVPTIWRGLRARQVWAGTALLGFLVLASTKLMDRARDLLRMWLDVDLSDAVVRWISPYEEGLELLAPILLVLAVWQFWQRSDPRDARLSDGPPA